VVECGLGDSLEVFVADDSLEEGAMGERRVFDGFELIGEGDTCECGALVECAIADSFEVFIEDDAFECGAIAERMLFDDFEIIGESDTREGGAPIECMRSYVRNVAVTEYHIHKMFTVVERILPNALKFGTAGEINSKKGRAPTEKRFAIPPNCSKVRASQVEIDAAVGIAPITKPLIQCPRRKLRFHVRIDDPFLD